MMALAPELTSDQVLQAFHYDAPYLFLGAAFVTVGVIAAAFSIIRRKNDLVLIYFAIFAVLYGARLWVQASLLGLVIHGSTFYLRLFVGINYVVPIPAFMFFDAAGLLHRRGKVLGYVMEIILGAIALMTFAFGPLPIYQTINTTVVIVALLAVVAQSLGSGDRDLVIVRRGLLTFVAFALFDNIVGAFRRYPRIEPYGFVAFLGALGYVAARQTLERDQQLNDIQKELEVARRIQLSILPGEFPDSAAFRVAARYVPMTSVAGDFYDFIVADEKQVGLLIADVSGHGVPAALIASMVKLAATAQRSNAGDPSGLLSGMNAALYGNTQNQFVTAAYVHLDARSRELRYSAAGHPPMLLLRDGAVQEVVENGLMLAAFDFATYSTAAHKLEPGDRLLLYTDGVLEAASASGEFFGQDALRALMRKTAGTAPSDAADQIISAVQKWANVQEDDLTVLVCDYLGHGNGEAN
jgi:sigma-B regulation protein RsbU (phosphoserine phosphatase)